MISGVASHGAELAFVWGDTVKVTVMGHADNPPRKSFTPKEQHLASMAMSYWGSFARGGDPNADTQPAQWPAVTPSAPFNSTMSFKIGSIAVAPDAMNNCALWGKLGLYQL